MQVGELRDDEAVEFRGQAGQRRDEAEDLQTPAAEVADHGTYYSYSSSSAQGDTGSLRRLPERRADEGADRPRRWALTPLVRRCARRQVRRYACPQVRAPLPQ